MARGRSFSTSTRCTRLACSWASRSALIFAANHSRVNFSLVFFSLVFSSSSSSSTFAYTSEQRLPLLFFSAHNQDGAVGMTDDRIGDTAHQSPPDPAQTSAAYHHESCAQLLRQVNYLRSCLPRP